MAIRITYDSKTIDLLIGPEGLDTQYLIERAQAKSGSGKIDTIVHYALIEGLLDARFTEATFQVLLAWWSWASQGKTWALAMDSSKVGNTTLDGAAAAGQKTVPLTATAAFAEGDVCLIRTAARLTYEVVTIDTISAGVSIAAEANLKFTYASGDGFRHKDYFPSLVSLDTKFKPVKRGEYYEHRFHFVESV